MIGADFAMVESMREKILAIRERQIEILAFGQAEDWPDYKYRVGYIAAMEETLGVIKDVIKELMEGK